MPVAIMIVTDLAAICLMAFGLYFVRHRRRDLAVAFIGVNVGVLSVSVVLGSSELGLGLGLGLFGVLSIIRLRSSEISQREVAYYFSALAIGLIAGLTSTITWIPFALIALILVAMFIADHPALLRSHQQQTLVLDGAFTTEKALRSHLESMLSARVTSLSVQQVNLVNDSTIVNVRFHAGDQRFTTTRARSALHDAQTPDAVAAATAHDGISR